MGPLKPTHQSKKLEAIRENNIKSEAKGVRSVEAKPMVAQQQNKNAFAIASQNTENVTGVDSHDDTSIYEDFISALESLRPKEELQLEKSTKNNSEIFFKKLKNFLTNHKKMIALIVLGVLLTSVLAVVAPVFAVIVPASSLVAILCYKARKFFPSRKAQNYSPLPTAAKDNSTINAVKKATYEIMRELFKDIGKESISLIQYKQLFKDLNKFLDEGKNIEYIEYFSLLDINEANDLKGTYDSNWIENYVRGIANETARIVKFIFNITEHNIENEEAKKVLAEKKLEFLKSPEKFSERFATRIFGNYIDNILTDNEFIDKKAEIIEHTTKAINQGIKDYRASLSASQ